MKFVVKSVRKNCDLLRISRTESEDWCKVGNVEIIRVIRLWKIGWVRHIESAGSEKYMQHFSWKS
jgi:hypothetical protein